MPVRTRSQRLKEESGNGNNCKDGNGSNGVTMSVPKKTTKKPRISKKRSTTSRKPKRLLDKLLENTDEIETKSEEISNQITPITPYKSNVDEFRQYVQNILDSPNKIDLPRKQERGTIIASPRVERITIKNKHNQQMEFLIPPKQKDAPLEIREKIRAVLNINDDDITYPNNSNNGDNNNTKEKSQSYPPIYNERVKLWSPHTQTYNETEAQRISNWLILLILSILTAIFFVYYQNTVVNFLKSQLTDLTPIAQSINQARESILNIISNGWSSMTNTNTDTNPNINTDITAHEVFNDNSVTK